MILKIQDKEYRLKYDINALAIFEDVTGMAISRAMSEDVGVKLLRALMYAGLERNHNLTLNEVGDLIQEYVNEHGSLEDLQQVLTKAFAEANLHGTKK